MKAKEIVDYLTYRSFVAQRELYDMSLENCVKLYGEIAKEWEKIRTAKNN